MKKILAIALVSLPFALTPAPHAQAADGVSMTTPESRWSVKDGIIGKTVYNENDDKAGDVTDILVSSDGKMTSFIVGAGGFLGMGEHNVAIPFDKITKSDGKLILAGYTKDQLKRLPAYKSPKVVRPMSPGTTGGPPASGTLGAPATPGAGMTSGTPSAPGTSTTK